MERRNVIHSMQGQGRRGGGHFFGLTPIRSNSSPPCRPFNILLLNLFSLIDCFLVKKYFFEHTMLFFFRLKILFFTRSLIFLTLFLYFSLYKKHLVSSIFSIQKFFFFRLNESIRDAEKNGIFLMVEPLSGRKGVKGRTL